MAGKCRIETQQIFGHDQGSPSLQRIGKVRVRVPKQTFPLLPRINATRSEIPIRESIAGQFGLHPLDQRKLSQQAISHTMQPAHPINKQRMGRSGLTEQALKLSFSVRAKYASQAGGLDDAFDALHALFPGPLLVGLVGVGFIAYGLFLFFRARYARL